MEKPLTRPFPYHEDQSVQSQGGVAPVSLSNPTSPPEGATTMSQGAQSAVINPPSRCTLPAPPQYHTLQEPHSLPSNFDSSDMEVLEGYESVGSPLQPPPSYEEAISERPSSQHINYPAITDEDVREALLQHINENCCWGTTAATEMKIHDIQTNSAFHYTLETFTEGRATNWVYEAYVGQAIDSPSNGPPPGPWEINVEPSEMFDNSETYLEVPHTASIKNCHYCTGRGKLRCGACKSEGRQKCPYCAGLGHHSHHTNADRTVEGYAICGTCAGTGHRTCMSCSGNGYHPCQVCQTRGKLKYYIRLTIKWINHTDDHVVDNLSLVPGNLIRKVNGHEAFKEEKERVWPISNFPDNKINSASRQLIERHRTAFPSERILMQRHRVRIIPLTKVQCSWHSQSVNQGFTYCVYGFENKVYAPEYPLQYCWGCDIL
ncbi:protein SSUH2 homolog [Glandiceps talaboti]